MNTMIANYVNGNLSDAKQAAKNYPLNKIRKFFSDSGYGNASGPIANYLKGIGSFQAAADAERR